MINLRPYEEALERILEDNIRAKGLVDSGALLSSIRVYLKMDPLSIEIESEDYLEYLEQENQVIRDFYNNPQFKDILEGALTEYIEDKLNNKD